MVSLFFIFCVIFFVYLFIIIIIILFNYIFYPFQAIQATFKVKEMVNYSHRKMKEEEGRRIAVMDAFQMAEKSDKDLKAKLAEEEKERKFAVAALSSIEKQAESQQLLLCTVED